MILSARGLGSPLEIRHGNVTITHMGALGADSSSSPPSRATWFLLGLGAAIFFPSIRDTLTGIMGLGNAGLSRARRRIEA